MADEATTSGAVTGNNNDSVATTTLVVGEHSVYKSVQDLIEGKRQADDYIAKLSQDLKEARAKAYAATEWISFENKYMRNDIGKAIDEA